MKKLLFLYNTHAGKGLLKSSQIRRLFRVLDEKIKMVFTNMKWTLIQ